MKKDPTATKTYAGDRKMAEYIISVLETKSEPWKIALLESKLAFVRKETLKNG